jgi:ribonuclease BN (tRNA processing enzyme)
MPRPGGACSSYLIRTDDASVVFDLGTGAFAKLLLAVDPTRIDAIVVTHMHADHFFDLVPLHYTMKYGDVRFERRLPVWLPPGGRSSLEALRRAVSPDAREDFFSGFFAVAEYDPAQELRINDLTLRFARTRHFVDAYAIRAESAGASLAYSADTAPCEPVVALASQASLFLCEAAVGLATEQGERGHSSAEEAGEMAARARAGRLLLTHYSAAHAPSSLAEAAAKHFAGPVAAVDDGMDFTV